MEGAPDIDLIAADTERVLALEDGRDRVERGALGRRARSLVDRSAGKYSRHRRVERRDRDIAVDATLRTAARRSGRARSELRVEAGDLQRKIREHHAPLAVCIVLDNSYSLHAERMVERVKGLAFHLLQDATGRGDRVALVAFAGGRPEAVVALPLTASVRLAADRLERVPLSGRTPLADALRRARLVLRAEMLKRPTAVPLVVIVSDGLPTQPLRAGGDPVADALEEARLMRRAHLRCVVIDASGPASPRSCAALLAEASGGVRVRFADVTDDEVAGLVARGAPVRRQEATT